MGWGARGCTLTARGLFSAMLRPKSTVNRGLGLVVAEPWAHVTSTCRASLRIERMAEGKRGTRSKISHAPTSKPSSWSNARRCRRWARTRPTSCARSRPTRASTSRTRTRAVRGRTGCGPGGRAGLAAAAGEHRRAGERRETGHEEGSSTRTSSLLLQNVQVANLNGCT